MSASVVSHASTDKPPKSAWVLIALVIGAVAANMNLGIANVTLPSIGRELDATQVQLTAVANAFTLGLACSVLYFGAIGDRYGRKMLFQWGAILSVPTALLSAFASNITVLISGRFLAGLAAGLLFPTTLSLVSSLYRNKAQTHAIALWSGIGSGFAAVGPLLGGLLLEKFWWGSVFLLTIPLVLIALALGTWVLPRNAGEASTSVDNIGGVLSIVAVAAFIIALLNIASYRWGVVIGGLLVAVVALVLFLKRQRVAPHPLVDLDCAKARTFWVALVAGTITFGSLIGTMFIGQQFTQNVMGESALTAAAMQLPMSVMVIAMSIPAGILVVKKGGRLTLMIGLSAVILAFVWIIVFWKAGASDIHIFGAYGLVGIGVGMAVTPASKALMASLPRSRAGMGSAFTDLTRDFGGSMMNAIMGTALAVAYSMTFEKALRALSPSQAATIGRDSAQQMVSSYEGAQSVASTYPANIGEKIVAEAADAFTTGKTWSMTAALIFTLGALILVAIAFPGKDKEKQFYTKMAQQD